MALLEGSLNGALGGVLWRALGMVPLEGCFQCSWNNALGAVL